MNRCKHHRPPRQRERLGVEFSSQSNYKALTYFRPFQAKGKPFSGTQLSPIKTLKHMATVKTSATASFDSTQVVRRAMAAVIKRLDGVKIDRLVKHTNLIGDWKDADPDKTYAGLVPVIGGVERFDLALLTFDLMLEDIPTYPADKVVFATPTDDLHKEASSYLASNTSATYDQWLDHLVTKFAGGGWVDVFTYPARNKKGGNWNNSVFGVSLTQK